MSFAPPIRILHLYISSGHNFFGHHEQPPGEYPMVEVPEIRCLAGRGVEADRFFDFRRDYKGQITFFANEVYEDLCVKLHVTAKVPSVFRRNVITAGVDLNELIDREFELQDVRFLGIAECSPCHWMDTAFAPGTEAALHGRGGLRAKILSTGILRTDARETGHL
jgi:MOSC domain-containing protein YiiM